MNIEEAIEEFSFFNEGDYITRNMSIAKDIVLLAYEKEKEKNKELNKLKGFEMLDIFNMGKQSSRQRIEFDYVDKEKIKAKIEEYEQDIKDFEEYWSKDPRKFKKEKSVDYYKLEALKELLEKE